MRSVAIIGRGLAGLACAYRFAKAGFAVTVIGPKAVEGSASQVALGISSQKGARVARTPLFAVKNSGHQNLKFWLEEVEADSGIHIPKYFSGLYEPFNSKEEGEEIYSRVCNDKASMQCLPQTLDKDEIKKCLDTKTEFESPIAGGFFYADDGWCHVPTLLTGLERALEKFGGKLIAEKIIKITPGENCGLVVHEISACHLFDEVVLAAGIFSNAILASSGFSVLKMCSRPGQNLLLPLSNLKNFYGTKKKYNFVMRSEVLRFGATTFSGEKFDETAKAEGFAKLKQKVTETFGRGIPLKNAFFDWGIRPKFKDRHPVVGRLALPGSSTPLMVALGYYKNGLQLADLSARFLVSQVSPNPLSQDMTAAFQHFQPQRFQNP